MVLTNECPQTAKAEMVLSADPDHIRCLWSCHHVATPVEKPRSKAALAKREIPPPATGPARGMRAGEYAILHLPPEGDD